MKAIYLTSANVGAVAARYLIKEEEYQERLPLGYYVIADFGNEDYFDVVTEAKFNIFFTKTGDIDNGWISVVFS